MVVSDADLQTAAHNIIAIQATRMKFSDSVSLRMSKLGFTSGEVACYHLGMLPAFALKAWTMAKEDIPEDIEME